jgi:hypothetical protein
MSKSQGTGAAAGTKSSQPQSETKLDREVTEERESKQENRSTREIKAEGKSISLSQEGIEKDVREQLKTNFEAWKEDSNDIDAREKFNSQASSIGKMAGLRGTRPRLEGDKLEFDE